MHRSGDRSVIRLLIDAEQGADACVKELEDLLQCSVNFDIDMVRHRAQETGWHSGNEHLKPQVCHGTSFAAAVVRPYHVACERYGFVIRQNGVIGQGVDGGPGGTH